MRLVSIVVCLALASFVVTVRGDGPDNRKPLEGTWRPQSAELAGEKWPDELLKAMKLVVNGDRYTVTIGEQTDEGTCSVDSAKSPMQMDIKGTKGPNEGKTFLAICELKGDTLRVCYDLSGKVRPTDFATKADTLLFLVTYKQVKE